MISYFQYNKGKFQICEDSLTAGVFDLFKYLPHDLFWNILKQSLVLDQLPGSCGAIQSISFWDKWNAEHTDNKNFVEPDVFIRFTDFDLIVEAKRYDENQQSHGQLEKEFISYLNEYAEDKKPVHLLLLGGLWAGDKQEKIIGKEKEIPLSKTKWSLLLESTQKIYKMLDRKELEYEKPRLLILEDIINVMGMHQYYSIPWLKDIQPMTINLNFPTSQFERNAGT